MPGSYDPFDSDFDQMDRPFESDQHSDLSDLSDLPAWKEEDTGEDMANWEEDLPYASTDFTTPTYLDEEDWY